MKLCIFEDSKYKDLYPLTYARPVFDLRCGRTRIREKIQRNFPTYDTVYFMRNHLGPAFKDEFQGTINSIESITDDDVFFTNGRLLAWKGFLKKSEDEVVALKGGDVVYARAKRDTLRRASVANIEEVLDKLKAELSTIEVDADLIEHPWDLVRNNPRAIVDDFDSIDRHGVFGKMSASAEIWGEVERVYVAETAEIQPFVVLDTHSGPIMIDEKVRIFPFTRIEGPCSVGSGSMIVRGNIREEVTIGPVCRIGGEVESSIIHGYSNKYHTGFLGHAYVGEWVNIGALATNSDLKNDYSSVEVYVDGRLVDTGDTKVGSFIGDHTKLGIGCLLNTGTVVGVACNLLGGEVLPKYVPSFSWFARGRISRGSGFRRTIEAERRAMARRNVEMSRAHIDILQRIFDETKEDRENLIKRSKVKAMSDT